MSKTADGKGGHAAILAGLMLGILLAALDQTVVATSLGRIVTDLDGFERLAWLFSAYMLASTVVIPIAGKLSDTYGRRPVYLAGMFVFLLGSALCGLAGARGEILGMDGITQLIVARGVQGLGGGAIFPVALATIADLYPPSERGKISGLFGAVFGLSSVVGPFLGGWIVDNVHVADIASWRWIFYVNLPVGILAIAMVWTHFPRVERKATGGIDYPGTITLSLALLAVLLVAVLNETYGWASPEIGALLALAAIATGAFLWAETRAASGRPWRFGASPGAALSLLAALLLLASLVTPWAELRAKSATVNPQLGLSGLLYGERAPSLLEGATVLVPVLGVAAAVVGVVGAAMLARSAAGRALAPRLLLGVAGLLALGAAATFGTGLAIGAEWPVPGDYPGATSEAGLGLSFAAIGGLVALVAALLAPARAEVPVDPIVPLSLFKDGVFTVAVLASLLGGAAMFIVITFMPTYLQGVLGITPTYSGSALVPLSLGVVAGNILSGVLMKRHGYKPFAVGGFAIVGVGYFILAQLGVDSPLWAAVLVMALLGFGVGMTIQTFFVAVQNSVERRYVGVATSSVTLFRTLGATIGVTALGAVFNRRLSEQIPENVDPTWMQQFLANPFVGGHVERIPQILLVPEAVANVSRAPGGAAAIDGVRLAFTESVATLWLIGAGIALLALGITTFLKSKRMKTAEEYNAQAAASSAH